MSVRCAAEVLDCQFPKENVESFAEDVGCHLRADFDGH